MFDDEIKTIEELQAKVIKKVNDYIWAHGSLLRYTITGEVQRIVKRLFEEYKENKVD